MHLRRLSTCCADGLGNALARTSAALERSTIAQPTSSHDPSGRFARYNFPGTLSRDEAVALVRRIPLPGEPLPITD